MFLPQPVSGIIFDKAVKKKKSQNKTNKQTNKNNSNKNYYLTNFIQLLLLEE